MNVSFPNEHVENMHKASSPHNHYKMVCLIALHFEKKAKTEFLPSLYLEMVTNLSIKKCRHNIGEL